VDGTSHPAIVALAAVLNDATGILRIPIGEVVVEYVEAREWPDSCLGAPQPGEGCADVVTPGFIITLGDGFTYHADQKGNVRRVVERPPVPDTEIRLRFTQSGWHRRLALRIRGQQRDAVRRARAGVASAHRGIGLLQRPQRASGRRPDRRRVHLLLVDRGRAQEPHRDALRRHRRGRQPGTQGSVHLGHGASAEAWPGHDTRSALTGPHTFEVGPP
jgi:hypothetical protein